MREDRLRQMQDYILKKETVSLEELCQVFEISINTVRRDLGELLKQGGIEKIYGGVCSKRNSSLIPFEQRSDSEIDNKEKIGKKAAEFIEDNDILYIDSGTTTLHIIEHLKDKKNITIITNSLNVITNALPYENINIIVMSGQLERKTNSFVGLNSIQVLQNYNIKKSFMAATGVAGDGGVTNSSPLEFEIKKKATQKGEKIFLLVDGKKFGKAALMTYANLKEFDYVITQGILPKEYIEMCKRDNVQVIISDEV